MSFPRSFIRSSLRAAIALGLVMLPGMLQAHSAWVENWKKQEEQLSKHGVAFQASYMGSFMSNVQGGFRQGTNWQGLLDVSMMADLNTLMGWKGAMFQAEVLWVQGRSASSMAYIGNINEVSNIQGMVNTVRPFHIWLQQKLLNDKLRLVAGWMSLDTDFMMSQSANLFVNSAFGPIQTWNMNFSAPVYPVSALGFMGEWQVTDRYDLKAGIYDGDTGGEKGNRRVANTRLGTDDGAAMLLEVARTHTIAGRPGTLKLGGGWDTGLTPVNATGAMVHGNGHFYAMLDQTLLAGIGKDAPDRLTTFVRSGRVIHPGRSMVGFTIEGGFTGRGFRSADMWGVAATYSQLSNSFVQATRSGGGLTSSAETALELTYKAQLAPWMWLQPTFQRIYNPQSGTPNATVLGMMMTLSF